MMIGKQICGWCLLAVISCSAAVSIRATVTATVGDPFVLSFGYSGRRFGISCHYRKDGKPFFPERLRVVQLLGRLSFLEITEEDAGIYQIGVVGRGIRFSRTITLLGACIATYICSYTDSNTVIVAFTDYS